MKKIKPNQQIKDPTGSDVVIRVENLTKEYRLGVINHGMLHQDLQSWWARVRGKEDPNSLISSGWHSSFSKENPHLLALDDVSFDVKQGEILGIIGRNGAGKSTLLKILSRVTAPTKGNIKIKGRVASLLEVGTGFHPELTGRENVYLNGAIMGMTKKEINSRFDEIVAFAEVEKFINTPVKRYSSGMYVRLAFAVAAHLEPEILVIDEVLAVGDAAFQKKCLGKMGDVAKGGRTVLFVSHNMGVISKLCEKSILLHHGKVIDISNTSAVVRQYNALYRQIEDNNKKCLITSEYVDIENITINGQDGHEIIVPSGCRYLEIKIACYAHHEAVIYPELRFFDFLGNCLFYYTPRLDSIQHTVSQGENNFDINLKMPNVTKGEYSLGLYIAMGDPFEKNVVDHSSFRTIIFDGEPLHGGRIVQYNKGNGAILLERKPNYT